MAFYQFSIKNPLETQQQKFTSITKKNPDRDQVNIKISCDQVYISEST